MFLMPSREVETNSEPFDKKEAEKLFSAIGFSLFFMLLIAVPLQYLFVTLAKRYLPHAITEPWFLWAATLIPMYFFGFPALLLIMKSKPPHHIQKQALNPSTVFILLLICFGAMYLGNILGAIVALAAGAITGNAFSNPLISFLSGSGIIFNFMATVIVAPIMEELIFRKLIIDRTIKYGESVSVILSALLFGLYHGNVFQLFYAFFLGAIFAFVYVKTGNIKYCILFHAIINFFGGIIAPAVLNTAFFSIYAGIVLILSISGIVLFSRNKKQFTLSDGEIVMPIMEKDAIIFLNPGMITLFVMVLIIFAMNFAAIA